MSDVLGDTSHLHQHRIDFNAVHTLVGASGHGAFRLVESPGLRHLLSARASAKIVSQTLTCQVIGPASADKAVSVHVAVIPASAPSHPSSEAQLLTIGGSAFAQHSLYVGAVSVPLAFSSEVAHQIKPAPIVGEPPLVVYVFTITGGTAKDQAYLRVSGVLEVDGIGYVQPCTTSGHNTKKSGKSDPIEAQTPLVPASLPSSVQPVSVSTLQVIEPAADEALAASPSVSLSAFWRLHSDFFWFIQTYHNTFSTKQNGVLPQFPTAIVSFEQLVPGKVCIKPAGVDLLKPGDKAWQRVLQFGVDDHDDLDVLDDELLYFFLVV